MFKPILCLVLFGIFISIFIFSILFLLKKEKYNSINIFGREFGLYKSYQPVVINILCFTIAIFIWIFISYNSYYHGLSSSTKKDNYSYMQQAEQLFNDTNSSLQENIEKFKMLTSVSISGITITNIDTGEEYKIKDLFFRGDANHFTKREDYESSRILKTNKGNFKFRFVYSVAPTKFVGITRSVTCSLSDIFFTGDTKYYKDLNLIDSFKTWQQGFFSAKNWQRSIDFFIPLFICLIIIYIIVGLWNKQKYSNEKLIETNTKLEEFKTIHSKMYSDLSNEINQIKQPIQAYDFSWDNYVNKIFQSERHDLKNKFPYLCDEKNFSEIEKQIAYKLKIEYFDKLKEAVLDNMKNLPNIVTYELQEINIKETLEAIIKKEEAITLGFEDGKAGVKFTLTNNFVVKDNEFCKINRHRLSSIVFNILTNANKACIAKNKEARLNKIRYSRSIWMSVNRITKNSKDFINVSINDNAGGFPDNIINKVYKTPVDSREYINGQKRQGEGTVYVNFFARYMNIEIQVENCIADDNNTGAKVSLLVPIYTK